VAAAVRRAVLEMVGSWQVNKNWLVQGRVASDGTGALGLLAKVWGTPSFTVGLSVDPRRALAAAASEGDGYPSTLARGGVGLSLLVENTGELRYERPSANATFSHPSVETPASSLEEREGRGGRPLVLQFNSRELDGGRADVGPRGRGGVTFALAGL
jgi:hypothetical protein